MDNTSIGKRRILEHRGRLEQIPIYYGKQIRLFIYQNDWVTLPLSALIAAMMAMVIRTMYGVDMQGTLEGAFALCCAAIWNGCFNSIQVVCRERAIIKREHRSGMHITSYLMAHVLHQAILCLVQTGLMVFVLYLSNVRIGGLGIVTSWMVLDIGITLYIITFVSDMLALMISCFVHTTTAAMTIMPFLLIFQIIFSGGLFPDIPEWAEPLANVTVSKYGLNCLAAQAHYNDLPVTDGWHLIRRLRNEKLLGPLTLKEALEVLDCEEMESMFTKEQLRERIVEKVTVNDLIQAYGEAEAREFIERKISEHSQMKAFASTKENVEDGWFSLLLLGLGCISIAIVSLELIDKDRR